MVKGGSNPTPRIWDLNLFGHLVYVRRDPDFLVNDPDHEEDLDPI